MTGGAGALRERVFLQKQAGGGGGSVGFNGAWETKLSAACRIQPLLGGKTLILTMRGQPALDAVDSTWRARNARSGTVYNIRSVEPDESYDFWTLLAESGVN
ncbi:head-tail adaptor protein [Rhizobium sullae]|uniref:Head-tail adaptor protein n=1 Tax=Rhizobium sullae TaxID=50338 RepID=A0ABY5XN20_RHISU|nr:head-tail adaptor protein [Rhizobium sullae]UWU16009.1 head-tail adaptor protein [Rhizobium sullae]